jgi:hypothetical protein
VSLLSDLETATNTENPPCKAKLVLDALSPEERALADRRRPDGSWAIPSKELSAVLKRYGTYIGKETLAAHRSGRCPCHS